MLSKFNLANYYQKIKITVEVLMEAFKYMELCVLVGRNMRKMMD